MSFRRKNIVVGAASGNVALSLPQEKQPPPSGTRPSPLDGRPVTSTGTPSLDAILGHSGLPLGSSILVEENGTTDFSGALLRYYAAEGLVQGHHVHVLGVGDGWVRELPGLAKKASIVHAVRGEVSDDKMKIAWRYEALRSPQAGAREAPMGAKPAASGSMVTFCHAYSLSSHLEPGDMKGHLHCSPVSPPIGPLQLTAGCKSPFRLFLEKLLARLESTPPNELHRICVPSLLSPTLYSADLCHPTEVLQFLHGLRSLLRRFSARLSAIVTLPISLYPRSKGTTRWMELLCDGVLEMIPLQQAPIYSLDSKNDDSVQGLLKIHSLLLHTERGRGSESSSVQEDLAFRLSVSSGLVIKPFSLPPVGDTTVSDSPSAKSTEKSLDF